MKNNSSVNPNWLNKFYKIVASDIDLRVILAEIFEASDIGEFEKKEVIEKSIRAVVYFENEKNFYNGQPIVENKELNDVIVDWLLLRECGFRLKCIITMNEFLTGEYECIYDAGKSVCTADIIQTVAEAFEKAKRKQKRINSFMDATLVATTLIGPCFGIYMIPIEAIALLEAYTKDDFCEKIGEISARRNFFKMRKRKIENLYNDYSDSADTSQEYFDPCYTHIA